VKKHTIELEDDLSTIYKDIAKMNHKTTEEVMQITLKNAINSLLSKCGQPDENKDQK